MHFTRTYTATLSFDVPWYPNGPYTAPIREYDSYIYSWLHSAVIIIIIMQHRHQLIVVKNEIIAIVIIHI